MPPPRGPGGLAGSPGSAGAPASGPRHAGGGEASRPGPGSAPAGRHARAAPCALTAFLLCLPLTAQSSFQTVNSSSTLTTYELLRKWQRPRVAA